MSLHSVRSGARISVCEQCSACFEMARSDQRFCSSFCRLRHWRTAQRSKGLTVEADHQLFALLRSELARIEQ